MSLNSYGVFPEKKISHSTPLPPHDGHLSLTATFFCGCCGEVQLYIFRELLNHTKTLEDNNIILIIFTYY